MYPLAKDKLRETEKRIRLSEIDLTKYLCQDCNEYYEVYIPLLLNGVPIFGNAGIKNKMKKLIQKIKFFLCFSITEYNQKLRRGKYYK